MKFGGSSLENAERIKNVFKIVNNNIALKPVIVLSAIADTTDCLLESAENALHGRIDASKIIKDHEKLCSDLHISSDTIKPFFLELQELLKKIAFAKELSPKTKDTLVSFGERMSVKIVSEFFNSQGLKSKSFDSFEIGFLTDSNFTDASLKEKSFKLIKKNLDYLKKNYSFTPIITGFIGMDSEKNITTLGRGGSDLTASVLAASLDAEEIQLWKDVDGILTTDNKICIKALPVRTISFEQASQLAYAGAKILHPRSIIPAMQKNIPVRVKNFLNPDFEGTLIVNELNEDTLVKCITLKKNIIVVDIVSLKMLGVHGFLSKVFNIFSNLEISIDMVATSDISISVTLDIQKNLSSEKEELLLKQLEIISKPIIKKGKAMISLIGNTEKSSLILRKVFKVLNDNNINVQMISQGASKINIGFIVNNEEADFILKKLHEEFFEQEKMKM